MDDSILAKVENQLQELQENIVKLRKTLRHWQTLEIDYEGLKEEFQGLPEDTPYKECLQAAKDFKPELVDDKELISLLDDKRGGHKRPSQLADVLSNRVDYVARNVSTIRKQLSDAEKRRNALLLAKDPEYQDDAGLPLGEIIEELDDEGRVISSKVQTPGKDAPDLLDVLRKAGIDDVKAVDGDSMQSNRVETDNIDGSLSDDSTPRPKQAASDLTSFLASADRVQDVSDDENDLPKRMLGPTNPNDTADDAALRQEMLQYDLSGLDEVGAIVAELDLEDSGKFSYDEDEDEDDYLSDYDEDEDLYTDESEDEKGATKNPIISGRYRKQMEALSKKHGITGLENLGPESEVSENVKEQLDRPSAAEAARQAAIARDEANKSVLKSTDRYEQPIGEPKAKKKKVAFAPELDIAKESSKTDHIIPEEPTVHPVGEEVIERTAAAGSNTAEPPSLEQIAAPKKISKFKAARSAAPPTPMFPPPMEFPTTTTTKSTPGGPAGLTISSNLVERPTSENSAPPDPIDFDEEIHRREVAMEYQKTRNQKIHEQGGYVRGGEAENYGEDFTPVPVIDEITGKPRKVSRFRAARMNLENK